MRFHLIFLFCLDFQEEERTRQEQACPQEREETAKEITSKTTNSFGENEQVKRILVQPMKENTGVIYVALSTSH